MDIDIPPVLDAGAQHHALSEFGLRYPLPFRILLLSTITVVGFATNLHILAKLGIDTACVLDIRLEQPTAPPTSATTFVHPTTVYPPLYSLGAVAFAWTAAGWLAFRAAAGGEADAAIHWRVLPAACLLAAAAAVAWPGKILYQRDRFRFLR